MKKGDAFCIPLQVFLTTSRDRAIILFGPAIEVLSKHG